MNDRYKTASFTIVLATKNIHKIRELRAMLSSIAQLDILSLQDFPQYSPPEETSSTFEENAIQKAVAAAETLQQWIIADDSGLVVPALNGEPGIFSARYAGNNATDADNRAKLLEKMSHLEGEDRAAYFACALALASPTGLYKSSFATCEGEILKAPRGGGGFGYDPLFLKHEYRKTFGELEERIKNRISHRRKAFDKLGLSLENLVKKRRI
ncbi:MAG: XTP/dITP diphosphatase [Parachlamydiales bacterium]|nr:XTP/dITP diphosphatase [Parachlamydiales bacterium]